MGKKHRHETEEERKERKRAKKEAKKREKELRLQSTESHVLEDFDELISNETDATNGVFQMKGIEMIVSLYPSALGDVLGNIQESLHAFLLKYSDGVGGIMLGFDDVTIMCDTQEPNTGRILNELPFIHYTVACNALVFNPTVGSKLTGGVNECFPSHIGMLVFRYFNAMISAEQLRIAGYSFDSSEQKWIQIETGKVVSAFDRIDFIVDKVHECGGTISLEGSNPSF